MSVRSLVRQVKRRTGIGRGHLVWHDPAWPKATGLGYTTFFERFHAVTPMEWYLEIGTSTGTSLLPVDCNVIAIDPEFHVARNVIGRKPSVHLFQLTSDAFFALDFLERNAIVIDVAFLDGMHLYEYLLRDFINTERNMRPGGRIFLHDCVPFNPAMADRTWDFSKTTPWTGDVWKILPILRAERPDLKITVLDAAPTGLVMVEALDPASRVLPDAYDRLTASWGAMTMDAYGIDRFRREFPLADTEAFLASQPNGAAAATSSRGSHG